MELIFLLSMGALAGTLAGLLGIGGGIIIVPVLALVFQARGINPDVLMHVAIGTSLGTIAVTSLSSIREHQKHKAIDWSVFKQITPGIIVGGFIGAAAGKFIDGESLRIAFGVFMLLVAAQMFKGFATKAHRTLPPATGIALTGIGIGTVSALMGVGGGSMSVPFLTWCNMAVRRAVATSAAIGFPIALAGAAGFVVTGWGVADRPIWSLGYVNVPAFFSIVVASTLFAPVGARLAHRISEQYLKRAFSVLLFILGFKVLLG